MQNIKHPEAIQVMKDRHSVRTYEKNRPIPKEDLESILQTAATAPSSWNLQHWKFLVIQDQAQKEQLLPICFNQQQVVDSPVTIAVLGDLEAYRNAEEVYGEQVAKGYMPENVKDTLIRQINAAYSGPNGNQIARDEAIRNASFAAMQLMLAAKSLGYDTVPMGGYDAQKLRETFRIPERYLPVLLISVGKAAKPAHASSRLPLKKLVVNNSF